MSAGQKMAVIGAGPVGLAAIKSCKEEDVDVICFERTHFFGGLWRYHEEDIDGVASVMKSTIMNVSKEFLAFSDFPPPIEYPNFMHHSFVYQYLLMYAEHFDLLRHIRYNKEVIDAMQDETYDEKGCWKITTKDSITGKLSEEVFNGIMVCTGHHVFPQLPHFPNQSAFNGKLLHTHGVKTCEYFRGKHIVIVGIGNSAVDCAVDAASFGEQVYLSTRRGTWITSKVVEKGQCFDLVQKTRFNLFRNSFRSFDALCDNIEKSLEEKFDHSVYNLKPKHRILNAHPTTSDNLPNLILSGRVIVKGNIDRFVSNGVVFDGDTSATEADVVIFATGYEIKFPFLESNLVRAENNVTHLYKYCILPNLKHPTLAIIGLVQPLGATFPIGEMQCRWYLQIFNKKIKLPPLESMEEDIISKRESNAKRYIATSRHTIQVEFIPFMDELADIIGAKPNLMRLALTDPKFFVSCVFGPCLPYQYRINGPHRWPGAKDALLNYKKRFLAPLNTRYQNSDLNDSWQTYYLIFSLFAVMVAIVSYLYFNNI